MSRLIDADLIQYEPMLSPKGNGQYEEVSVAYKSQIDDLPTIERKKGKWNVYYHGEADFSYSCNQCGYSAPYGQYGGEYSQKKWRFCPHCGAEMDS